VHARREVQALPCLRGASPSRDDPSCTRCGVHFFRPGDMSCHAATSQRPTTTSPFNHSRPLPLPPLDTSRYPCPHSSFGSISTRGTQGLGRRQKHTSSRYMMSAPLRSSILTSSSLPPPAASMRLALTSSCFHSQRELGHLSAATAQRQRAHDMGCCK